ncbi:serine/threonine-protein kinase [Bailinhaonella thermotolerans]|uniref:serine/threonine-protein kinase n=1 Tax=Bailinhaonella thermotolerans TaxID=1070861 RepID=UPI001F5BB144|nr:serine/threonine-protein kinase [Bailinhaonella thermotolerans]
MGSGPPLSPGDPAEIGPYTVVARLGEGGQGVVYLARGEDGREVAIKLLHARVAADAEARARFLREVSVTTRVARFCTAQVLRTDVYDDRPYLVSEYVPGPSLAWLVRNEGPRRGAALDRLAISTATALAAIHRAGVLHRDFKPANVLMGPDGPVVIDFGIARAVDAGATATTSQVIGTPAYMAPEQLGGADLSPAADVFAWGVTMVFAATGRAAFGDQSIPAVLNRVLNEEPDLGDLTGPLRDLVAACLAKDPAARPTAETLLLHLLGKPLADLRPGADPGRPDAPVPLPAGGPGEPAVRPYGAGAPGGGPGQTSTHPVPGPPAHAGAPGGRTPDANRPGETARPGPAAVPGPGDAAHAVPGQGNGARAVPGLGGAAGAVAGRAGGAGAAPGDAGGTREVTRAGLRRGRERGPARPGWLGRPALLGAGAAAAALLVSGGVAVVADPFELRGNERGMLGAAATGAAANRAGDASSPPAQEQVVLPPPAGTRVTPGPSPADKPAEDPAKPGRPTARPEGEDPSGQKGEPSDPGTPPGNEDPAPEETPDEPAPRPTAQPKPSPTPKPPSPKPPAPKPNPYTAAGVCGSGYKVVDSHAVGSGATVYLLYNAAKGYNCVITMRRNVAGAKVAMASILQVKGGSSDSDKGSFTYYAGPVRLPAKARCVIWGGEHAGARWVSGWSHCG